MASETTNGTAEGATCGLEKLLADWLTLGANGRKVLLELSGRLAMGARLHGDFTPKDWAREAAEEDLDGAIYRAARMVLHKAPQEAPQEAPLAIGDLVEGDWAGGVRRVHE